jgi:broad specificity phosphatase PhoE
MPVKLYVVRHGETEWSLSGQHTGSTDIPLTVRGEEEAKRLAPWLSGIHFSAVLCSPRQRAKRTSELAGLGSLAQVEPDLAEWDYGDYEGLLTSEIAKERPRWNIFADGCPNGELPDQVSARADRLIGRLEAFDGNVALFSHGHFSRVLAARWIGLPTIGGAAAHVRYRLPQHPAGRPTASREPCHLPLECRAANTRGAVKLSLCAVPSFVPSLGANSRFVRVLCAPKTGGIPPFLGTGRGAHRFAKPL